MKYTFFILFFIVFLALLAGAVVYLSSRFALFFPFLSKKAWIWGFGILLVVAFTNLLAFTTTANPIGKVLFIFSGTTSVVFLFLLMSVAVVDLLNLIFKFQSQMRGILSIGLALLLAVYGVWNAFSLKTKEITIPVKGLTQEIRVVHLTDVHLGNYNGKKQIDKIVGKIKELNPDVIFNTGDMFDSKAHFGNESDVLSAFRTLNIPHYFVYGNHDEHVGVQEVIKQMKNANAKVLLNEIAQFEGLQIVGLNNMPADRNTFDLHALPNSETIEDVMTKLEINENLPTIILHHRPDGVKYMHEKGADLLLAGHTHAGQVFPFSLIAKLMFDYNSGLYKYENMSIYVSEGVGAIFAPVRFGTNNEIALIKLIPEE